MSLIKVSSTSSTEMEILPSSIVLDSIILDTTGISTSISIISVVSIFVASPTISTIVSIPSTQAISARIVETKPQPSTKKIIKGKEKEEDVDLDEEIVIPNWDISKLNLDQIQTFGELLQKKAKQKRLREERDKELKIIEDAKNILAEALGIEVDSSEPILYQLVEVVQNYNEDLDG